jgi:hypothetical protein
MEIFSDGFIREGDLIAQRIKMSDIGGHRVALWSIQDTEFNTVTYSLVSTRTGMSTESDSLEHLERLYDICIQCLTAELNGGSSHVGIA